MPVAHQPVQDLALLVEDPPAPAERHAEGGVLVAAPAHRRLDDQALSAPQVLGLGGRYAHYRSLVAEAVHLALR
ncbi:hypothetical protein [Amycolatopsis sp. cmx-4-61]|uniref:hypothetical protein n=1 Tax=Amycolatopsis sp. cmx-4-61 TaxID=2790937 RepID=UPI00397AF719